MDRSSIPPMGDNSVELGAWRDTKYEYTPFAGAVVNIDTMITDLESRAGSLLNSSVFSATLFSRASDGSSSRSSQAFTAEALEVDKYDRPPSNAYRRWTFAAEPTPHFEMMPKWRCSAAVHMGLPVHRKPWILHPFQLDPPPEDPALIKTSSVCTAWSWDGNESEGAQELDDNSDDEGLPSKRWLSFLDPENMSEYPSRYEPEMPPEEPEEERFTAKKLLARLLSSSASSKTADNSRGDKTPDVAADADKASGVGDDSSVPGDESVITGDETSVCESKASSVSAKASGSGKKGRKNQAQSSGKKASSTANKARANAKAPGSNRKASNSRFGEKTSGFGGRASSAREKVSNLRDRPQSLGTKTSTVGAKARDKALGDKVPSRKSFTTGEENSGPTAGEKNTGAKALSERTPGSRAPSAREKTPGASGKGPAAIGADARAKTAHSSGALKKAPNSTRAPVKPVKSGTKPVMSGVSMPAHWMSRPRPRPPVVKKKPEPPREPDPFGLNETIRRLLSDSTACRRLLPRHVQLDLLDTQTWDESLSLLARNNIGTRDQLRGVGRALWK